MKKQPAFRELPLWERILVAAAIAVWIAWDIAAIYLPFYFPGATY